MWLDRDRCYRAVMAHDARFDGRLFVGVASTRIYCRPVCTARSPRREHCRFFATAAAAEGQGFRPCLRCRPELAPGNAIVDAPRGLATRAASLIEDGVLGDGGGLDALATRLGITDRHLRRVFQGEFGVSPVEFAQTQRLLLAKRLLTDTALSVTEVAMASGFASLRRFNALFRARYRLTPTDLRRRSSLSSADTFRFLLQDQAPLDWDGMLAFLSARTVDGVEEVDANLYRRTVRIPHRGVEHVGWIAVSRRNRRYPIELHVHATLAGVLPQVVARVKRLFDLGCPIRDVELALGRLAHARPGLRVPGAFDGFELAVRAILGQQVTVKAARTLAGRFARAFGDPIATPFEGLGVLFPTAARVATLEPAQIARVGIIGSRARAITTLARHMADETIVLEPGTPLAPVLDSLRALPGIGEWTTQYIAMRALSWPDAFPERDTGVMKAMNEPTAARRRARAAAWQPWRAYAVMHLWRSLETGTVPRAAAPAEPHGRLHQSATL